MLVCFTASSSAIPEEDNEDLPLPCAVLGRVTVVLYLVE